MIEFALTDGGPLVRPWACVICTGNVGVMCDTHRELPGYGNVYVCELCAKLVGRAFGFVRGKRMNDLAQASKTIEQRDAELRVARDAAAAHEEKADEMTTLAANLTDELEIARGRIAQLEARFAEHAREALELAGVAATSEGSE